MKIARYLFKLLFNCSFDYFLIYLGVINPQMIEVLFVDEIATNMPLQIHSQRAETCLREEHYLNFAWNHLVSNRFCIDIDDRFEEKNLNFLFKILANGANKFSAVTYQHLNTKLYNLIIKVCTLIKLGNIEAYRPLFFLNNFPIYFYKMVRLFLSSIQFSAIRQSKIILFV